MYEHTDDDFERDNAPDEPWFVEAWDTVAFVLDDGREGFFDNDQFVEVSE